MDPADAVAREAAAQFITTGSGASFFYISQDSDVFRRRVEAMFPRHAPIRVL
jgi:hypothetical protein